MDDTITINLWYDGTLEDTPRPKYVGGYSALLRLDVDKLSYFEIVDYVMDTGCYKSKDYDLYCIDKTGVLKRLVSDKDVTEFATSTNPLDPLDLYVHQGPISKPNLDASVTHSNPFSSPTRSPIISPTSSPISSPLPSNYTPRYTKASARRLALEATNSDGLVKDKESVVDVIDLDTTTVVKSQVPKYTKSTARRRDTENGGSDDDSDSSEEDGDADKEVIDEEVISCDSDDDDEWRESVAKIKKVKQADAESTQKVLEECLNKFVGPGLTEIETEAQGIEAHSSYEDSDGDVNTPGESEDDDILGKKYKEIVPVVNEQTNWKKFKWVVGTRFPTRESVKEAVRKYAVATGRDLTISVGDKSRQGRVGVSCIKGCPFFIYCSFHSGKGCYMVKKVIKNHNCQRNMSRNRQLTSQFIATEFLPVFKARPHWSAKEIQLAVKEKYKVIIKKWMAYKAKKRAHKMLHGAYCEADFDKAVKEMTEIDKDAAEAFLKQNPRCFSRCFLKTKTKTDVNVNNMAETFNGYIIQARSKHLYFMLEDIRVAIMTRLTTMHTQMSKEDVIVCPRIQTKLNKEKNLAVWQSTQSKAAKAIKASKAGYYQGKGKIQGQMSAVSWLAYVLNGHAVFWMWFLVWLLEEDDDTDFILSSVLYAWCWCEEDDGIRATFI
ncbi:hypothetical protein QVD17_07928 [Tagetes erecta]|uniref:PB1-like domain-containing protein n=1 Tax=Tagetes erecta TaxID=13708 RepID=A0AAD8KZJ5_TARER|nr:hypothetical protein QVD17_07928 [Tagetes erecta]